MFSTGTSILLALTGVTLLFHRVGMWAAFRYRRRAPRFASGPELPPLSLLKPIKGLEDELEQNLASFFEQDYPAALELIFASTDPADPGLALARSVAARYPRVASRFVFARTDFGLNPKVCNLQAALQAAAHDLVLQSDANVRIPPGYLRRLVAEKQGEQAALIGSLVVGVGERTPAAKLENLQLTGFVAPGLCMAKELADIPCVLGKAMLFSRAEFEALGGLARVKDVLAEDYVMVQLYEQHGLSVRLSPSTVENVNARTSWKQFASRHARWLKMRAVVSVPGFAADIGSNPLPFALAAFATSGLDPRVLWVIAFSLLYKAYWDRKLLLGFRGHGLGLDQLWATPARDLSLTAIWLYAMFSRSTEWRGQRLRLGAGSVLQPDQGSVPVRLLRRMKLLRS